VGNIARATIAYGIVLDEDHECPWDISHEGNLEQWWLDYTGYVDPDGLTSENIDNGGYNFGKSRTQTYLDNRKSWLNDHPIPVEAQLMGPHDESQRVLVMPNHILECDWSGAEPLPRGFFSVPPEEILSFCDFIEQHDIRLDNEPEWILFVFYG
jgi:hypothetical protein